MSFSENDEEPGVVGAKARSPQSTSEYDHHGFVVAAKAGHSPVGSVVVTKVIPDQVVNYRQDAAVYFTSSASDPVAIFLFSRGN